MRVALAAVLAVWLGACGDDAAGSGSDAGHGEGGVAPDAAADAGPLCSKRWQRQTLPGGQNAGASISGGALLLHSTSTTGGAAYVVKQTGLTIDFDATLTFSGFTAGGPGGYARAILSEVTNGTPEKLYSAGIVSAPAAGVRATVEATGMPVVEDVKPGSETSGSFRFHKIGNSITVTATSGTQVATLQSFYGVTPLQLGVEIGSSAAGTPETSIRITGFTLTGGGGFVTADDFHCDSLFP